MKSYKLELTHQAESVLKHLFEREPELARRLAQALDDLEKDPFQGKALRGELRGLYSYRVGSYRVIYQIHKNELLVIVIDIGHRRDIYR